MPELEMLELSKSYGDLHALREMSLTVTAGEIVGFVGSNGAGKTTAMRIAVGVLAADGGEVRWDGRPVDLSISRRMGYMPEERGLYPRMRVGHQLAYLARLHGRSTDEADASVRRWTEVLGISGRVDDEVQKLSLGNQQRVQLCAALVADPDILILDEPFSGLDPVAVDVMSRVLRERADAGVPVLFSSHQLDLVERLCDRVGIIKEGSMVAVGTIDDLRTRGGLRWQVDGPPAALGWPDPRPRGPGGEQRGHPHRRRGRGRVGAVGPGPAAGRAGGRSRRRVRPGPPAPRRAVPGRGQRHQPPGDRRRHGTGGGRVSTLETIRLVAGREVATRIRSRAFLWTTGILLVAIVGGGVVLDLALGSSSATTVAVTPQTESLAQPIQELARGSGQSVDVVRVPDDAAAETAVRDEDVDAALTGDPPDFTVVVRTEPEPAQYAMFTVLRQQAALGSVVSELGGDPAAVSEQLASATPDVRALDPAPERDGGQIAAGYVAGILLFLALQTTAQLVAQGVVEEKSTRVVELLLSTIRPWQLMAGKVLGIGAIGLAQVVVVIGAAAGTALALGLLDTSSLDLGTTVVWALAWFALGFVTFSLALAALASLVSRQEDVASVTAPVLLLMIIPYVIGISIAPWDPTNTIVVVLSYVPFAAPLVMPMRIALGTVETWQVLASFALSAALVPVLVWAAGRIYSNAVLRTGARVSLRDALRTR